MFWFPCFEISFGLAFHCLFGIDFGRDLTEFIGTVEHILLGFIPVTILVGELYKFEPKIVPCGPFFCLLPDQFTAAMRQSSCGPKGIFGCGAGDVYLLLVVNLL